MSEGFVKLPREIVYWRWFSDPNVLMLYIFLLTKAAFKKTEYKNETLEEGQVLTGRKTLAEQLGISKSMVTRILKKLESSGDIAVKTTNKYTVITLLKWGETQKNDYFFYGQTNNKRTTNEQQVNSNRTHNNNLNNLNNLNNFKKKGAGAREKEYDIYNGSIDWSQMDIIINGG